jgi:hypothetical protein
MNNNTPTTRKKKTITLSIYLHDDLRDYDKDTLLKDYFSWLVTEIENISGRPVLLLFPNRVRGVCDFAYQNKNELRSLDAWADAIDAAVIQKVEHHNPYDKDLDKFLLLTRYDINSSFAGAAHPGGRFAIASITSYRNPAHELGHMLNATDEDSRVVYDGWWNDSIMSKQVIGSVFRGNDYHFSEKNRENIQNHLNQFD